eukprot:g32737.t1
MSITGGAKTALPVSSRRSAMPRISFSVDAVVQERFKKMIRFKRAGTPSAVNAGDRSDLFEAEWDALRDAKHRRTRRN